MSKNKSKNKSKNNVDIAELNIPNLCFSFIGTNKTDERYKLFSKQRKVRGFDDSETWAFDYVLAKFIVPRLERYIEITKNKIKFDDKQKSALDNMLVAFKLAIKDGDGDILTDKEYKKIEKGLKAFSKYYRMLWW